jgi:hypothetical protein
VDQAISPRSAPRPRLPRQHGRDSRLPRRIADVSGRLAMGDSIVMIDVFLTFSLYVFGGARHFIRHRQE